MSAKSVVSAVTGFLAKHIADLNNIAGVLTELTNSVPIDAQDKARITTAIQTVQQSADNIQAYLSGNSVTGSDVTIKESDIVTALGDFFASDAGKAALANAAGLASAEGNANG